MRLLAVKLPPEAVRAARRRTVRQAQRKGRVVSTTVLALAGWVLLITTLDERSWPDADVLRLYRARWHVELVYKRMKSMLDLNQIRSKQVTSAEASVRALRVAWALQETEACAVRQVLAQLTMLPRGLPATTPVPVSSWQLTALCLATLRQQVQGQWSHAQLRTCLPQLQRYLVSSPRRRQHQEASVRVWLDRRPSARRVPRQTAA